MCLTPRGRACTTAAKYWLVGNMHAGSTLHITIPNLRILPAGAYYNPGTMRILPFNHNPHRLHPIQALIRQILIIKVYGWSISVIGFQARRWVYTVCKTRLGEKKIYGSQKRSTLWEGKWSSKRVLPLRRGLLTIDHQPLTIDHVVCCLCE